MQTIPESETPIFQELNAELGELPEINIHDFEEHSFGFTAEGAESGSTGDEAAPEKEKTEAGSTETNAEQAVAAAPENSSGATNTAAKNPAGLAPVADTTATESETDTESAPAAAVESAPRKGGRRRKSN